MSNFYDEIMEGLSDSLEHVEETKKLRTHKVVVRPIGKINNEDVRCIRCKFVGQPKQFGQQYKRINKDG